MVTNPWKWTTALAMVSATPLVLSAACTALAAMPHGDAADALRVAAVLATVGGILALAGCLVGVVVLSSEGR